MEIRQSDKAVFILGAGFSTCAGLPVMRQFMARARVLYFGHRKSGHPFAEHFDALLQFQAECQAASWFFNRDWDNIEELYTQADLLRLAEGTPEAILRCEHIAWAIWDVYRRHNSVPERLPPFRDVLRKTKDRGLQPVVVTTNYDLLCEASRNTVSTGNVVKRPTDWQFYYPGFQVPWRSPNGQSLVEDAAVGADYNDPAATPEESVAVIKLHGSVNWFQPVGETRTVALRTFGEMQFGKVGVAEETFDVDFVSRSHFEGRPIVPMIIPPMLGKMSVAPVVASQWKAAIHAISSAKEILVIGYSFPQTDVFMVRLLAEGIKANLGLERFIIADIAPAGEWTDRGHMMFTPVARSKKVGYVQVGVDRLLEAFSQYDPERFIGENTASL